MCMASAGMPNPCFTKTEKDSVKKSCKITVCQTVYINVPVGDQFDPNCQICRSWFRVCIRDVNPSGNANTTGPSGPWFTCDSLEVDGQRTLIWRYLSSPGRSEASSSPCWPLWPNPAVTTLHESGPEVVQGRICDRSCTCFWYGRRPVYKVLTGSQGCLELEHSRRLGRWGSCYYYYRHLNDLAFTSFPASSTAGTLCM